MRSRDAIRDRAGRDGWSHLRAWHAPDGPAAPVDYFIRGDLIVRVEYDRACRVVGAHKWERGGRSVARLTRLTSGKADLVIGWICG